ncbi:MAG: VCBS repeat-containing protein [Chloracidobacterium sp.]|nr:VCBS repeat-containing protein [Chloracidobacterium sp.]
MRLRAKERWLVIGSMVCLAAIGVNAAKVTLADTDRRNNGRLRQSVPDANAAGGQVDLVGPVGSGQFGAQVAVLPNGNIVVTDPLFDLPGPIADVGAVYLYDGNTLSEISRLTGSAAGDRVGSSGITVLSNGNYVIMSSGWNNGAATSAGAVTFGNAKTGISGMVSAANSLIGSTTLDEVGGNGVTKLSNGNYVVPSPNWDAPGAANAGAATFGNGNTGVTGTVSAANSLVGSTANDSVSLAITALTNGNYVVSNPNWDGPGAVNAGAVTFGNGTIGTSGTISAANSLVGSTANDTLAGVGAGSAVTALTNGNYVVTSTRWDAPGVVDAGAATFGNGTTGVSGPISAANSLIGSTANDRIGNFGTSTGSGVTPLANGNYVVVSQFWNAPGAALAGAATFGNGTTGTTGTVSAANSLVGSAANHNVGSSGVTALTNGNYVVSSRQWDGPGALQAGAATFGNGTTGISGTISAANSLVGTRASDSVGTGGIIALTNGNYVVISPVWASATASAIGAVTLGNGTTGISGTISSANSLIGSTAQDRVGGGGVTALTNGNYVVATPEWDAPGVVNVGAVTLGNGATGVTGTISAANSLVGSTAADFVGSNNGGNSSVVALTNGNYIVASVSWDSPGAADVGAVTFGNGTTGVTGAVSAANSLVGSTASDSVNFVILGLTNGNYVVRNPNWDAPGLVNAGAVTFGNGTIGTSGTISAAKSLVGSTASDQVGSGGVTPLTNGSYVVSTPGWDNGATANAGAVTYGIGSGGTSGPISSSNSVVGTVTGVLSFSSTLSNGRMVVGQRLRNIVTVFDPDPATVRSPFDFDGDGKTDVGIFRPGPAEWWYRRSSDGQVPALQFGTSTDAIAPVDYTGDGKSDVAFFRPTTGEWFILRSEDGSFYSFPFGGAGDTPVPADYDGDGKGDVAVFRSTNNTWYIQRSSDLGVSIITFGASGDLPVTADYDGDGKSDIGIFRPGPGEWWYLRSSDGGNRAFQFGTSTDKTVVGDYTGDGKADAAFFRPTTGEWFILRSEDGSFYSFPFGGAGDTPVPGDYDGDGKTDAAVFRPSSATWFMLGSTSGTQIIPFGAATDRPIPNAFVR